MKRLSKKPLAVAVGMALASPAAMAVNLDFSGSNIYMKFLDGNQHIADKNAGSIDTASGADQGQFTELELRIKAVISPKVEAGARIQSRSSDAYWSEFGGFGYEGDVNNHVDKQKFMKLRGAYVQLTPGYDWLNMARIGSSDWGMFDPFTVGKVRYIDRDNYNGLYFKGPLAKGSWEVARVSLPEYLQTNYGQGPSCCSSDATAKQEATWIGQVRMPVGPARITASAQLQNDHVLKTDTTPFDGQDVTTFAKDKVYMLKGEGNVLDRLDVKGAFYRSDFHTNTPWDNVANPWINSPADSISDNAFKLDLGLTEMGVSGLTVAYQYFNIGEGFYSNTAARTEADVLLTEGSEAAWYGWGDPKWNGGAYSDFIQGATTPSGISGPNRAGYRAGGQNGLTDNAFKDFNEAPSESALGWKGHTLLFNYDPSNIPMSAELTRVSYNNNWQNYSATGPLSHFYATNQDRTTDIFVFKASHNFAVAGGLDTSFKFKWVNDKDNVSSTTSADDAKSVDKGYTLSVGKQLHNDLYGSLSYGRYTRDLTVGAANYDNEKGIWSLKFNYSLAGFEAGLLAQWINGDGDPLRTGTKVDIDQYRLKATVQSIF